MSLLIDFTFEYFENSLFSADESVCRGPQTPAAPRGNSKDCSKAKCPEGYQCFQGLQQAECCEMTVQSKCLQSNLQLKSADIVYRFYKIV